MAGNWNSGRRKQPIALSVLRGYPGKRPLHEPAPMAEWMPTAEQLAALGLSGRAFVARVQAEYEFSIIEGELVLAAATIADRLEQLRQARAEADLKLRLRLDRVEQQWLKQFASLAGALKSK